MSNELTFPALVLPNYEQSPNKPVELGDGSIISAVDFVRELGKLGKLRFMLPKNCDLYHVTHDITKKYGNLLSLAFAAGKDKDNRIVFAALIFPASYLFSPGELEKMIQKESARIDKVLGCKEALSWVIQNRFKLIREHC